jgi:hypothetical protein
LGNQDIGWKEGLEFYFEPAMELMFPDAHAQIDWSRGYEFLDKELQQILPESEIGPRYVDKLAKVYLKNGDEHWVLLHVDVQGDPQKHFSQRMYVYNDRGLGRKDVQALFRLIYWFLVLPPEMEDQIWRDVELIEKEK